MKTKLVLTKFFIGILLLVSPLFSNAQENERFTLTRASIENGKTAWLAEAGWRFSAGDDPNWAAPVFDDAAWTTLSHSYLRKADLAAMSWNGSGWFRLRLRVAPDAVNMPLNLEGWHLGASEIYLDGKPVRQFGVVGKTLEDETAYNPNAEPLGIVFDSAGEHLLAVRYSNQASADPNSVYGKWLREIGRCGFSLRLRSFDATANQSWDGSFGFTYVVVQTTVSFAFCILHLLLFALYPRQRGNLFYSLFLLGGAVNQLCSSLILAGHYGAIGYYWLLLLNGSAVALFFSALPAFIFTDFYGRLPRYLWFFPLAGILRVLLLAFTEFELEAGLFAMINFLAYSAIAIIMVRAIRKRIEDAWIVGVGVFFIILIILNDIVGGIIGGFSTNVFFILDFLGSYTLVLSITIYLARQFARTSTNLETQLVKEVEHERAVNALALEREQEKMRFAIVEAENERRAQELEEARQLQLSMLPKKLPVIPNLEIAAYMKPASEVGGDYYDFHVSDDHTLTVAVGDATGHGLKAGTVVTATKSLFSSFASLPRIADTLNNISRALKAMNLRGLFMAMTLLKIRDGAMTLGVAGMPSVLIYRAASKTVEEIIERAMPLGSMTKTNYREQEISLGKGDCVVVMSDGFPEMFNEQDEILGFEKAARVLPNIAHHSAQEIIDRLVEIGEKWAGARAAADDVTFIVLKTV